MACEVGVFMDKILFFIRLTALPWNYLLLLKRQGAVTARASYLLCTLIRGASLLDTGQPWIFQSNSEVDASSLETPECLYCSLWNCFNNDTISPSLCTVSSPLAKPGKLLPLVSLSQEKKSGTSIQMITELGKLSLCPLLPFVPPRSVAPLLISLSWFIWLQSRLSPLPWLHFEHIFILRSGWNWLSCFGPLFTDFFIFLIYFGAFFFLFSFFQLGFCRASLGLWSCSVCPCGCFHSNTPSASHHPYLPSLPPPHTH